ncbi:hypothetical protein BV22DRAFT_1084969 [Leucogyrophana mollusca]|uniref:Uncharacterized protein n=1 Tax=Leucogyrophana mollusca TaxID=85980 RepID=A0ACB8BPD5_9AGAM|nr:hypothetical protein BV22DRAFT_1084969 [Leucogyrophana mollusca]
MAAPSDACVYSPNSAAALLSMSMPSGSITTTSHRRKENSSSSQRTSIDHLPTELLLKIFKYAYVNARDEVHLTGIGHSKLRGSPSEDFETEWAREDPLSPSLFPYALAAVCSQWGNIMASVPVFWTRVILIMEFTTLPSAQTYIQWTGNHPFDVTVIGHPDMSVGDGRDERAKVAEMTKMLVPHLHRCTSLRFSLSRSSLISIARQHLRGTAAMLRHLELACAVDDGVAEQEDIDTHWDLHTPCLQALHIDGRSFPHICRGQYGENPRYLRSLAISKFKPSHDEDRPLQLSHIVSMMNHAHILSSFAVQDVELVGLDFAEPLAVYHHRGHIHALQFEGVASDFLYQFFRSVKSYPEKVLITRSSVEDLDNIPNSRLLTLGDIASPDDLATVLTSWTGQELTLKHCSGFDDHFINVLSPNILDSPWICTNLAVLHLHSCTNFSAHRLKRVVQERHAIVEKKIYQWFGMPRHLVPMGVEAIERAIGWNFIRVLRIYGGPSISANHLKWFRENVREFYWSNQPAPELKEHPLAYGQHDYFHMHEY